MPKLAVIQTKQTTSSVTGFINSIADEQKRKDSYVILQLMEKATKEKPAMWGSSMIGFGKLVYKSPATGREVEWFRIGFSPRKTNLSLHLMDMERHAGGTGETGQAQNRPGLFIHQQTGRHQPGRFKKIITAAAK